jgi:D-alanyl-D-alanine carboxypeptidase/D-alanyl-D-alanine-endopeptidase (penicillin-binding protein 4)
MIVEFFPGTLLGVWLKQTGWVKPPAHSAAGLSTALLQPVDAQRNQITATYLEQLNRQGLDPAQQGLWLQTDHELLVNQGGHRRYTPASLTKVATTLAAIKTWGPKHRFKLDIGGSSPIQDGVLVGDLTVQGDGDPLLTTSEVIFLANQLNALGLRRVTGNLVVSGGFSVNLATDLQASGAQLKTLWNSTTWTPNEQTVFAAMPKGTPQPQLVIEGDVVVASPISLEKPLYSHRSLPLASLLKFMNVYSNNAIAEWLTAQMGGPEVIQTIALQTERVAPAEVLIKNGSGLGQENQLSPRAVVGLLQGITAEIQPHGLTLADFFPVAGQDRGTFEKRTMPKATVAKTGTLWNTSGLAGVIPTKRYGPVWFAIMNQGDDYTDGFRSAQDQLLQSFVQHWGTSPPSASTTVLHSPTEQLRRQGVNRFMQNDFLSH